MAMMLAGVKAPSASPMAARMTIRLPTPVASPLKPASSEKPIREGTMTRLKPILSARLPVNNEAKPQAIANAPVM